MKWRTHQLLPVAIAGLLAGCSSDAIRDSADRDVRAIIKERQEATLGYDNSALVSPTTQPVIRKKIYDTLPVTRFPDSSATPIEDRSPTPRFAPLGPPAPDSSPLPTLENDIVQDTADALHGKFEYGPPASMGPAIHLGLFESIGYAIEHSREYQSRSESLYLAALNVTLQRHLFEPRPFATETFRYTGSQLDGDYAAALSATSNVGVRQQLPYGGEIVASALVNFVHALNDNVNDGESAQLALRGSIPLWRGAGMVNLEPLIASERQVVYAIRDHETYRRAFAVDVSSRYFRLLTRQRALRNRYQNYVNLQNLVDRTQALFDAGRVAALEVQRAQQSLLQAEDLLNSAQQSLDTDLDSFKLLLGMPVSQQLEIVPLDFEVAALKVSSDEAAKLALSYRLDAQTARDRVDDAVRAVDNARNALGPDITLGAGGTIGNRADTPAKSIDGRTLAYDASLTIDLPVDRLQERNRFRAALIDLEQSRRSATQVDEQILADVRSAQRGIRSAEISVAIQRLGIDIARQRLDLANSQLQSGKATSNRDVVEAQSSLLTAQDAYDRALADLQIQMLQFLRDTGTLRVDPMAGTLGLAMKRGTPQLAE